MSQSINPASLMAASAAASTDSADGSKWFEAMAEAWGRTLDAKASAIEATANELSTGNDQPSVVTKLSAQSLEMSFMSQGAHTSISSVGTALETMARKQ